MIEQSVQIPTIPSMAQLLEQSAELHRHLCPRQVLGVRMGMQAAPLLGLELPQSTKRVLAIVETDGCFTSGVAVATNCWVGRRTMRVEDYGKVAATFVDTQTATAVRIAPHPQRAYAGGQICTGSRQQLAGDAAGVSAHACQRTVGLAIRRPAPTVGGNHQSPRARVTCQQCGEEILNEREVHLGGMTLCRACAYGGYYRVVDCQADQFAARRDQDDAAR